MKHFREWAVYYLSVLCIAPLPFAVPASLYHSAPFSPSTARPTLDTFQKHLSDGARMMHSAGRRVEKMCALREAELEQLHRAQRDTLELEISWLPKPRIKYTNRFLELQKTKAGYVKPTLTTQR